MHQKEPMYEFSKVLKNFHKFTKYGIFSTLHPYTGLIDLFN